jgi:hypothetical protein
MVDDPLAEAAEYANRATDKYFEWVRLMLSLCTASLTALVALQNNYIPSSPSALYLLWGSWVSLAGSILTAAISLRAEGLTLRGMSRAILEEHSQDSNSRVISGRPPRICVISSRALPWLLAMSLVLLCAFAICNSAVSLPSVKQ